MPVKVHDNGKVYRARILAGHVGIGCGAKPRKRSSAKRTSLWCDDVRPIIGWWMYKTKAESTLEEQAEAKSEKRKVDSEI